MDWLFGVALLPILLCGGMMLGRMLLAGLGLRRVAPPPARRRDGSSEDTVAGRARELLP